MKNEKSIFTKKNPFQNYFQTFFYSIKNNYLAEIIRNKKILWIFEWSSRQNFQKNFFFRKTESFGRIKKKYLEIIKFFHSKN